MRKLLLAAPILLAACAGSIPGESLQGAAGINRGIVEMPDGTRVEVLGGKDNSSVMIKGDIGAGTFEYSATDSTGIDQVRARAVLEEAISDDVKETFPGIVQAIIDALVGL